MVIEDRINNSDHSSKDKEAKGSGVESNVLQTSWFAIAGSLSSGKTTLVQKLHDYYGFRVVNDHARAVITETRQAGISQEEFLENRQFHQDKIAERYINACCGLDRSQPAIHDYGLPCIYAFYTANGLIASQEIQTACETFRYKKVFLVSPLQMVDDTVRITTDFQRAIYFEIVEAYKQFGYQVVHVPSFYRDREKSINARFDFVKDQIDKSLITKKTSAKSPKEKVLA